MATSPNATQITPPRVPIIDERTGAVSREWYRWFYSLYNIVGNGLGIVPVPSGGTGLSTIPTNGQLLIGNGTGYTLNTLGTGAGISVTNGAGTISVANTGVLSNIAGSGITVSGATGDVTITNAGVLSFSAGTTGLTPAAATTGDIVLAGTLGTTNGGTNGSATPTAYGVAYGTGTAYAFTAAGTTKQALLANTGAAPTWSTLTTGSSILYGDGSGGFSNVTIGTGVSFVGGTLSATGSGGSVTSVSFTGGIVTVATATTTPALTVAGTSGGIPYFSSGTTWATSAALAANAIVLGGGAGAAPATTTTGTGVVTALGINTGTAGAFVVNGGALGTPSSGTVTNLTGTASININGTVGATTANTGAFTTLSATGVTTVQAGTALLPAITTTGDTDTGIFFPAANTIAFTTNGVDSARFSSGFLGINNSSPATYLDIVGAVGTVTSPTFLNQTMAVLRNNFHARMAFVNPSSTYSGDISRYNASAAFPTHTFSLNGAGHFIFTSGNGTVATTEKMRIDSSGNLLVGTTSQIRSGFLSVSGVISTNNNINWGPAGNGRIFSDVNWGCIFQADRASPAVADFLWQNAGGTERMRIDASGIVSMSAYGAGAATFSAAGVISSVSDETWKIKDGVPVDPDSMLKKLEPGYWYYNDEKKETFGTARELGFYAQNVNAAIGPEAAPPPEEGKPWGYYDRSVLAVTVMSLQKALATIESLTARITALETP